MIARINCWRRAKINRPCPDRPRIASPSPTSAELEDMIEKGKRPETTGEERWSHEDGGGLNSIYRHSLSVTSNNESIRPMFSSLKDQSSATTAETVYRRLDSATCRVCAASVSRDSYLLEASSKKSRLWSRESPSVLKTVGPKSMWWVGFGPGKSYPNHATVRLRSLKAS